MKKILIGACVYIVIVFAVWIGMRIKPVTIDRETIIKTPVQIEKFTVNEIGEEEAKLLSSRYQHGEDVLYEFKVDSRYTNLLLFKDNKKKTSLFVLLEK